MSASCSLLHTLGLTFIFTVCVPRRVVKDHCVRRSCAAASPALGIAAPRSAPYPQHMRNAPARIEIDLQVDEEVLEETLDIIESFLDDLGHLTLIRSAHICVEDDSREHVDLSGPMPTEMIQCTYTAAHSRREKVEPRGAPGLRRHCASSA